MPATKGTEIAPVYLIRHGETEFNRDGRYQGRKDSPLTRQGIAQAEAVAGELVRRLDGMSPRILASPLPRATRTAEIVASRFTRSPAIAPEPRLIEVAMGAWDGLTRAEIAKGWPDARRGRSQREWIFHAPGGERIAEVSARVSSLLSELATGEAFVPTILVSHAGTGRIIRAVHGDIPVLEALKLDAPQDGIFALRLDGSIDFLETESYRLRHAAMGPDTSTP